MCDAFIVVCPCVLRTRVFVRHCLGGSFANTLKTKDPFIESAVGTIVRNLSELWFKLSIEKQWIYILYERVYFIKYNIEIKNNKLILKIRNVKMTKMTKI